MKYEVSSLFRTARTLRRKSRILPVQEAFIEAILFCVLRSLIPFSIVCQ